MTRLILKHWLYASDVWQVLAYCSKKYKRPMGDINKEGIVRLHILKEIGREKHGNGGLLKES